MYYRLTCNMDKYRNYYLKEEVKEGGELYFETFDGRSHKDIYTPRNFILTAKREIKNPIADMVFAYPICSEKAKNVISSICDEGEVEFFPCTLEGCDETYYIFNVLGSEDCVDYEKSEFIKFPSSGKIMFFNHIEIGKEVNRHIFRIKDIAKSHYFVDERTKKILEAANLEGLEFDNSLFVKNK